MVYTYKMEVFEANPSDIRQEADLQQYYRLRAEVFNRAYQDVQNKPAYYNEPVESDLREGTVFMLFKAVDNETDKEIIFGGRKIIPCDTHNPDSFPFLTKDIIDDSAFRFTSLVGKTKLALEDIIPATKYNKDIKFVEFGGFAIDINLTKQLFTTEQYKMIKSDIYQTSITEAKKTGADIAISDATLKNVKNQLGLMNELGIEYAHLYKTKTYFKDFLSGDQSTELLLMNLSKQYSLKGKKGILRPTNKEHGLER